MGHTYERDEGQAPVFIVCCARSGSTLLRYILDTHPQIACPPELHIASLLGQLSWRWQILESSEVALGHVRNLVDKALGAYAQQRQKKIWCEKSVSTVDYLDAVTTVFPDARFLCLYRHCLDVVASAIVVVRFDRAGRYGFESYVASNPSNLMDALVSYWVEKTATELRFQAAHRNQCIPVHFESLVLNPVDTLNGVFDFLQVPWDPALLHNIFVTPHQIGPGDRKILFATKIDPKCIGRGTQLQTDRITQDQFRQMKELLQELGYGICNPPGTAPLLRSAAARSSSNANPSAEVQAPLDQLARDLREHVLTHDEQ
jgi:hypothetical protein